MGGEMGGGDGRRDERRREERREERVEGKTKALVGEARDAAGGRGTTTCIEASSAAASPAPWSITSRKAMDVSRVTTPLAVIVAVAAPPAPCAPRGPVSVAKRRIGSMPMPVVARPGPAAGASSGPVGKDEPRLAVGSASLVVC